MKKALLERALMPGLWHHKQSCHCKWSTLKSLTFPALCFPLAECYLKLRFLVSWMDLLLIFHLNFILAWNWSFSIWHQFLYGIFFLSVFISLLYAKPVSYSLLSFIITRLDKPCTHRSIPMFWHTIMRRNLEGAPNVYIFTRSIALVAWSCTCWLIKGWLSLHLMFLMKFQIAARVLYKAAFGFDKCQNFYP